MSKLAAIEETVSSALSLRGAKRCFLFSRTEDDIRSNEDLPRVLVAAAREMGIAILDGRLERDTEHLLGHVVIARRYGEVAVCLVGDETLDETEAQRKLNVLAIRMQVVASREPHNALLVALREAYVACTMPLSGRIFDREIDELKRRGQRLDESTLRPFVESLARSLTPPSNELLVKRTDEIFRTVESSRPSSSFPVASARLSSRPVPASQPASQPAARRSTVPVMAAVQDVVRTFVGPLGDLMVQRALENIGSAGGLDSGDTEALLATIAAQLPPHKRERFVSDGRQAVESARRAGATR